MSVHASRQDEADASYERCVRLYNTWRRHERAGHRIRAFIASWRSEWAKMGYEDRFGSFDD